MSGSSHYEELVARVTERLGEREAAHSIAVSEVAAELAERYDVDVDQARLAGLLHDWAREMSGEELLAAAARYGISVTPVDEAVPYLLHAAVGAEQLREEMGDLPVYGVGESLEVVRRKANPQGF